MKPKLIAAWLIVVWLILFGIWPFAITGHDTAKHHLAELDIFVHILGIILLVVLGATSLRLRYMNWRRDNDL